jgi:hypothetical protein
MTVAADVWRAFTPPAQPLRRLTVSRALRTEVWCVADRVRAAAGCGDAYFDQARLATTRLAFLTPGSLKNQSKAAQPASASCWPSFSTAGSMITPAGWLSGGS